MSPSSCPPQLLTQPVASSPRQLCSWQAQHSSTTSTEEAPRKGSSDVWRGPRAPHTQPLHAHPGCLLGGVQTAHPHDREHSPSEASGAKEPDGEGSCGTCHSVARPGRTPRPATATQTKVGSWAMGGTVSAATRPGPTHLAKSRPGPLPKVPQSTQGPSPQVPQNQPGPLVRDPRVPQRGRRKWARRCQPLATEPRAQNLGVPCSCDILSASSSPPSSLQRGACGDSPARSATGMECGLNRTPRGQTSLLPS